MQRLAFGSMALAILGLTGTSVQHGRVYPPAAGRRAVLLSTAPRLSGNPLELRAPVPIPRDSGAFEWRGELSAERWAMIEPLRRQR
jgi:hypothetical protein